MTTNPLQDTDIDLGDVDIDDIRILYEYHHSADAYACYVIEAETFQLHGKAIYIYIACAWEDQRVKVYFYFPNIVQLRCEESFIMARQYFKA